MVEEEMTNEEMAHAIELIAASDAFSDNWLACAILKMVAKRLRDKSSQALCF